MQHYTSGYHIVYVDMIFNRSFNPHWNNGTTNHDWCKDPDKVGTGPGQFLYDTMGTAVHEFGHALGLGDYFGTPRQAMFTSDKDQPRCWSRRLGDGDKAGVRYIYDQSPGD